MKSKTAKHGNGKIGSVDTYELILNDTISAVQMMHEDGKSTEEIAHKAASIVGPRIERLRELIGQAALVEQGRKYSIL